MNKNVSQNFLLMKDNEQIQILQYLSKDFRKKYLFNHLQYLYTLKIQYLKNLNKKDHMQIHKPQLKMHNTAASIPIPIRAPAPAPAPAPKEKPKTLILRPTLDFSKYITKFLVTEKLISIVANKTIAMIGPAEYLQNIEQGSKIDACDIIIRFNGSISIPAEMTDKIGSRTDVWIYNFKNSDILANLPVKLPKLIFCPYPKDMISNADNLKNLPEIPLECIENDFYQQLLMALQFEPNSFLLVLLILLRQNVKSIYVSGFSFMYDGYYDGKQPSETSASNALITNKENRTGAMSVVKKIYNANDRLFLDNTMLPIRTKKYIYISAKIWFHKNYRRKCILLSTLLFQKCLPMKSI